MAVRRIKAGRAVEIISPHYGSGYRIGGRLVLTAAHLVGDRGSYSWVRKRSDTSGKIEWEKDAQVIWRAPNADAALVELPNDIEGIELADLGQLPADSIAERIPFDMYGWPKWSQTTRRGEKPKAARRHIPGEIFLADHSPEGFLVLEPKRIGGMPLPGERGSQWEGMSGAAVVCNGIVVAVQHSHQRPDRPQSLEAEPLTKFIDNEEFRRLLSEHGFPLVFPEVPISVLGEGELHRYMIMRGGDPYYHFFGSPSEPWEKFIQKVQHVSDLRAKLILDEKIKQPLKQPISITVRGTLFPCALLACGWWERSKEKDKITRIAWQDYGLQEWLFNGFDLWAPSWDFSWNLEEAADAPQKSYYIAQLGSGDEADSLPVVVQQEKARKLREKFLESWGGLEVKITGLLGRRTHFSKLKELELFGGTLDYCLWLDDDDKRHKIEVQEARTEIYSGYLWKCLAPRKWLEKGQKLRLNRVYFIWEHTNFVKKDAVQYNLDGLAHKEAYLEKMHGDLILIQKSSWLVPGEPAWLPQEIYDILVSRKCEEIC